MFQNMNAFIFNGLAQVLAGDNMFSLRQPYCTTDLKQESKCLVLCRQIDWPVFLLLYFLKVALSVLNQPVIMVGTKFSHLSQKSSVRTCNAGSSFFGCFCQMSTTWSVEWLLFVQFGIIPIGCSLDLLFAIRFCLTCMFTFCSPVCRSQEMGMYRLS